MRLSEHFTLEEMTFSDTAARLDLDNSPPPRVLENLRYTAEQMEAVRATLGVPIRVSSGYRSPAVDLAIRHGVIPARPSPHTYGLAVDFTAPAFGTPEATAKAIAASGQAFDQLILEFGAWVHISFSRHNGRHETLTIYRQYGRPGLYKPGLLTFKEYGS